MPHKKAHTTYRDCEAARIVNQAAVKDSSIKEAINVLMPGRIAVFLQNRFGRFELEVINRYDVGEVLSNSIVSARERQSLSAFSIAFQKPY
jgi:alkaline phosphatase